MARMPWLGRVLSLALIGQGTCFQLAGYPLRSTDGRGDKANGTKSAIRRTPGRVRSGRLRHVREAATAVRPDGSESGHGKASGPDKNKRWDKRGQEAEEEAAAGSYLLMDYFIRWDMSWMLDLGVFVLAARPSGIPIYLPTPRRCSTWAHCCTTVTALGVVC